MGKRKWKAYFMSVRCQRDLQCVSSRHFCGCPKKWQTQTDDNFTVHIGDLHATLQNGGDVGYCWPVGHHTTTLPRAAYFIGRPGGINVKYANTSTVWIQIFAQHRVSKLVSQNCASVASIYFHFIVCVACAKGAEKEHLSSVLFIQFGNGACGMGKCFNWKLAAQFELNVPPRIRLVRFGVHTRAIQRRDEATLECGSINCVILMADISIDFIFLLFLLETFCTLHLSDEFVFN